MTNEQLDLYVQNKVNELVEGYFIKATGGSNRMWAKRYQAMTNKWEFINALPSMSEDYKKGYKAAMDNFLELGRKENENS